MENIFLVYELDDCQHMVLKGVFFDFAKAAILAINSTTGKLWDDYFVQETPPGETVVVAEWKYCMGKNICKTTFDSDGNVEQSIRFYKINYMPNGRTLVKVDPT